MATYLQELCKVQNEYLRNPTMKAWIDRSDAISGVKQLLEKEKHEVESEAWDDCTVEISDVSVALPTCQESGRLVMTATVLMQNKSGNTILNRQVSIIYQCGRLEVYMNSYKAKNMALSETYYYNHPSIYESQVSCIMDLLWSMLNLYL